MMLVKVQSFPPPIFTCSLLFSEKKNCPGPVYDTWEKSVSTSSSFL